MIKMPITNTGKIRYLEFIKIFVLVSFLLTFGSSSVLNMWVLRYAAIVTSNTYVLVFTSVVMAIISDFIEVYHLLKDYIITWISIPVIRIKVLYQTIVVSYVSTFIALLSPQKRCVIRC